MSSDTSPGDIPAGFRAMKLEYGFVGINGPLYGKLDNGKVVMGFRVEERHSNPGKIAHGGMLATFADMLLPITARIEAKEDMGFVPTVSLSLDFLGPAKLGAWVEGRADVLRTGKSIFYVQGLVTSDGAPCLRASGVFKITSQKPPAGLPSFDFFNKLMTE